MLVYMVKSSLAYNNPHELQNQLLAPFLRDGFCVCLNMFVEGNLMMSTLWEVLALGVRPSYGKSWTRSPFTYPSIILIANYLTANKLQAICCLQEFQLDAIGD